MSLAAQFTAFVDWVTGFNPEDAEMEFLVEESDLRALVEMAEDALIVRADEYGQYPASDQREVLERAWKILGRPYPDYFKRHFGWKEAAVA